jgi:alpha-glucosidase
MLGLPGASYLYQGEELGLFEHTTLPDESRQDPTFFRTNGARVGRDGCRVPLPWDNSAPALGFSTGKPWLPQPEGFAQLSRSNQSSEGSTLSFYKDILRLRKEHAMGSGSFEWLETNQYLSFRNQSITVIHNFSSSPIRVEGEVLVCSGQIIDGNLQPNDSVWLKN